MQNFNIIFGLFAILLYSNSTAQEKQYSYAQLYKMFNTYSENDERGLVFVNLYLSKAKKEEKALKLISGYEEAVYYSSTTEKKIKYSDSAVALSKVLDDPNMISSAYLKRGIVYYYNKRDYRKALQEYVFAYDYAKKGDDFYVRNKIIYHLGMVKLYLGYYGDAAMHFTETANYYEKNVAGKRHQNVRLNYEVGYLNSIYRLSTCYRNLKQFNKEDSLITIGFKRIEDIKEFPLEYAYFQKGRGIQLLRTGNINNALKHLTAADKILMHEKDFASLATVKFYLGQLYWKVGVRNKALIYFNKVDSLISKFKFITPEINANYQYLILDAEQKKDHRRQLYYTNRLISVDSVMKADFSELSTQVYKKYDRALFNADKNQLEKKNKIGIGFIIIIIISSCSIVYYFVVRFRRKEIILNEKYSQLLKKINRDNDEETDNISVRENGTKELYSSELIEKVKVNLKVFVQKEKFRNKHLTLEDAAKIVGCKRNALSYILNTHMNTNFNNYLKLLRIQYITRKLMDDPVYLKYSMDTLAEECGMKNRIVFSNHFLEINDIRPADFVRKRTEALKNT